jgi:L-lactate dehydrogenase complex protein LldG
MTTPNTKINNKDLLSGSGSSRDRILATVKQNQPLAAGLPAIINYDQHYEDVIKKYVEVLRFIGGEAHLVKDYEEVLRIIKENFAHTSRIVSSCEELSSVAEVNTFIEDPHTLADVDLFITTATIGVAENAALWVKDEQLVSRALPFIAQQIAVIIKKENIVATMHDAYDLIGDAEYGYAAFIAGPSKTADIAQSLVLGAHGPKTMTVFIF